MEREVLSLGAQPVSNALVRPETVGSGERFFPLNVMICDACHLAQLVDCPPADVHFHADYVYFSSFSDSWLEHCQRYAEQMISRFSPRPGALMLEVASNDGYLLKIYRRLGYPVLGIEPSASVANAAIGAGVPTEVRFFGKSLGQELAGRGIAPEFIVANNVLAHVPDLNDFAAGFPPLMSDRTVLTCEIHYFRDLIEKNQFDSFYHEHYSYFTVAAARDLFQRHEMRLFDVERLPTHGGSLRLYMCRAQSHHTNTDRLRDTLADEQTFFDALPIVLDDFQKRVFDVCTSLRQFLVDMRREGRSVAGFGAPAKASTLLNMAGIRRQLLPYTVDNNPSKQGKMLPGVHIPILTADAITIDKPDFLLILPWNLRTEIASNYDVIRQWGGRFVVPIPKLEIF